MVMMRMEREIGPLGQSDTHQPRNAISIDAATDFEQKSPKIVVLLPNSAFELENDGRV